MAAAATVVEAVAVVVEPEAEAEEAAEEVGITAVEVDMEVAVVVTVGAEAGMEEVVVDTEVAVVVEAMVEGEADLATTVVNLVIWLVIAHPLKVEVEEADGEVVATAQVVVDLVVAGGAEVVAAAVAMRATPVANLVTSPVIALMRRELIYVYLHHHAGVVGCFVSCSQAR